MLAKDKIDGVEKLTLRYGDLVRRMGEGGFECYGLESHGALVSRGKTIMRLMILALVLTLSGPAFGQSSLVFMNGNELHQECQNQTPYCVGYVTGVADALEAVTGSVPHTCRPKQVELMQMVDLAVQTLIDKPASRHRPAFNILAEAFVETWPC